jgi:hypothetical protein
MTTAMPLSHSDEEVLAAFVDGQLTGEELQQVISHLAECEECRLTIADPAMFQQQEEEQQRRRASRRVWWGAAAAVAIAVVALPAYRGYHDYATNREADNSLQMLYGIEARTDRPQGRLNRQMTYAKPRPTFRGAERSDVPIELQAAAADIWGKFDKETLQGAVRAKAAAQAATENTPAGAISTLASIAPAKRDAATWNDLAALLQTDPNRLHEALAAADRALQLKPGMPEALFNRAMILKKMPDERAADAAIKDYLAVDPQSQWAEEVKKPQF